MGGFFLPTKNVLFKHICDTYEMYYIDRKLLIVYIHIYMYAYTVRERERELYYYIKGMVKESTDAIFLNLCM